MPAVYMSRAHTDGPTGQFGCIGASMFNVADDERSRPSMEMSRTAFIGFISYFNTVMFGFAMYASLTGATPFTHGHCYCFCIALGTMALRCYCNWDELY